MAVCSYQCTTNFCIRVPSPWSLWRTRALIVIFCASVWPPTHCRFVEGTPIVGGGEKLGRHQRPVCLVNFPHRSSSRERGRWSTFGPSVYAAFHRDPNSLTRKDVVKLHGPPARGRRLWEMDSRLPPTSYNQLLVRQWVKQDRQRGQLRHPDAPAVFQLHGMHGVDTGVEGVNGGRCPQ